MTRLALACFVVVVSACAARGPSPQLLAELGKADALVREGCYACLKEALAIYERLAVAQRPPDGSRQGAFDAARLIALREKELGLPFEAAMDRARKASAQLPSVAPPAVPTQIAAALVIAAAGLFIGETSGMDPEQRAQFTGRGIPALDPTAPGRRALDNAPASDFIAAYLGLAIDCEQTRLRDSIDMAALKARYAGVPLMQFRMASCARGGGGDARLVRDANPRWLDTLPWEARRELAGTGPERNIDLLRVVALLTQAREAFPASFAIAMLWAQTNMSLAEYATALSGYDDVLSPSPTHRDAMLGRLTSLSYLMRHDDAIATATRLIDLGTWHIGDAHYWRAWNYYNLKNYEPAWQDVEKALTLLSNSSVYMLAGLIEYARVNLPMAIQRFDRSFEIDGTNCDAVWMSGLVNVDQQAWAPASPKFSKAMSCFVTAAARAKGDLDRLEALIEGRGDPPTTRQLKQRESYQKQIATADERAAQAAFNAAQGYGRLGQRGPALTHVDLAVAHPKMKEKAEALKAAIEKLP